MKKGIFVFAILMAVVLISSSFSIRENPQDPIRGGKKHIKLIKEDNGKKVELDTVIESGHTFIWDGDTIGKDLKWITKEGFSFGADSLVKSMDLDYHIDMTDCEDGKKIIIIKKDNGKFNGNVNAVWVDDDGKKTMIRTPNAPNVIAVPHIKAIKEQNRRNIIDLSDPGIISYNKKKLSGGREKIEIIRNEVSNKVEDVEIINENMGNHFMIQSEKPEISKNIKIIKKGDGAYTVLDEEGEESEYTNEKGELVKIKEIRKDDGSIIRIEEIKDGNSKRVKVTVNEDVEKKSDK